MPPRNVVESIYLTKAETAVYLRLSPRSVDTLVAQGKLRAFRPGKKVLFPRSDLDSYVQSHRVGQDLDALVNETLRELRGEQ